jgi:hypothetical protein
MLQCNTKYPAVRRDMPGTLRPASERVNGFLALQQKHDLQRSIRTGRVRAWPRL